MKTYGKNKVHNINSYIGFLLKIENYYNKF